MKGKVVHKKYYMRPDGMRKQQISDTHIESEPKLRFAKRCRKPVRVIALAAAILYFLLGVAAYSWGLTHGETVNANDYFELAIVSAIIFSVGCIISFIISAFLSVAAKKDINERNAEEIEMHPDHFRYWYRKSNSGANRHELIAEFKNFKVEYNPMLRRLTLKGILQEMHIEGAIVGEEKKTTHTIQSFVIYDYFDPSLHLALKRKGIPILDELTKEWG